MVAICTTCFKILELYILPTQSVFVSNMVVTINSDYFSKQHKTGWPFRRIRNGVPVRHVSTKFSYTASN
jgi:hypothetical protein